MATIAGTVMVLYAIMLMGTIEGILGHILTASIISAPAAITIAKIMVPESGVKTSGDLAGDNLYPGPMDAITKGTTQGVELLLNICAMIIVLVAMVHLVNQCLGLLPAISGEACLPRVPVRCWRDPCDLYDRCCCRVVHLMDRKPGAYYQMRFGTALFLDIFK